MTHRVVSPEWYYRGDSGIEGPVSLSELANYVRLGKLNQSHLVRCAVDGEWITADSIPELFGGARDAESPSNLKDTLTFSPGPRQELDGVEVPGYEICGVLGRGGMGVVFQARHLQLNRFVALKLMRATDRAEDRARFRLEAESVGRLEHPHIVRIYDVGEHRGQPYIAFEYMPGGSLATKLQRRPLPFSDAATIVRKLAEAIESAHRAGLIHRDLKPSNVLLSATGEPKVADFGLVKQVDVESDCTHTGHILGTPQYMAPEQASGLVSMVGPRADIWALGAILYELLTGRPPFQGASTLETLDQVRTQEPVSPRRLLPKTPLDLETICLKCLEKSPERRYPSAELLAADLQRFLDDRPIVARRVGVAERAFKWARRRPQVAGLISLSALSLMILFAVIVWSNVRLQLLNSDLKVQRDNAKRQEKRAVAGEGVARRSQANAEARELDARRHAYVSGTSLGFQAYEMGDVERTLEQLRQHIPAKGASDLRGFEWGCLWKLCHNARQTLLGHGAEVDFVTYSRDGKILASASDDRTIRLWNGESGELRHVLRGHTDRVGMIAFSPDGRLLASTSFGLYSSSPDLGIRLWDVETGERVGEIAAPRTVRSVAFSSDAKKLAAGDTNNVIRIYDVESKQQLQELTGHDNWITALAFLADDRQLISASFDNGIRIWDLQTKAQLAELIGHSHVVHSLDVSRDGKIVATGSTDGTSRIWDIANRKEIAKYNFGGEGRVSLSADGKRLVIGGKSVTVVNLADKNVETRLLGHSGWVRGVAFHPNGRTIASCGVDATVRLWDVAPPAEERIGHSRPVWRAAYSRDERIVATCSADSTVQIWDAETGFHQRTLEGHTNTVFALAFSPDGHWLATGSFDSTVKLWNVESFESEFDIQLDGQVSALAFAPNSQQIAIGSGPLCVIVDIPKERTALTPLRQLKTHSAPVTALAYSPDGKLLASGGMDKKVWIHDATFNDAAAVPCEGHLDHVFGLAFRPDGTQLATASYDRTVRIWDVMTGVEHQVLKGFRGQPRCVTWHPSGERVAAGLIANSNEPSIWIWELAKSKSPKSFNTRSNTIGLEYSKDGQSILAAVSTNSAEIWDPDRQEEKLMFSARRGVWSVAVSPDEKLLALGGSGIVRVLELPSHNERFRIDKLRFEVRALAFSPDSLSLLVGEARRSKESSIGAKVFDVANGAVVAELEPQAGGVLAVAWSPDGRFMATGGPIGTGVGGQIRLWNAKTRELEATFLQSERVVRSLGFTPDSNFVFATSADQYPNVAADVRIWDLNSRQESFAFTTQRASFAACVSPSGKYLAIGDAENTVKVWDLAKREMLTSLSGSRANVISLCFLGDDSRLASGSSDGKLHFWDLTTQQQLGSVTLRTEELRQLAFAPKHRVLFAGFVDVRGNGSWNSLSESSSQGASGPTLRLMAQLKEHGVTVTHVEPGSATHTSDVKVGDVLLLIDGQAINRASDINVALIDHLPGQVVKLELERNGVKQIKNVPLSSR